MSKSNLSFDVPLLCGFAIPFHAINVILKFSRAINITITEEVLSFSVSLFSGFEKWLQSFTIPFACLDIILTNAFPVMVTTTKF